MRRDGPNLDKPDLSIGDLPSRISVRAASDIWFSFVTAPLRHLVTLGDEDAHHPVMPGAAFPIGICIVKLALKRIFLRIASEVESV